jgi:hypothetical protein
MPSLSSLPHLPREVLVALAAVVVLLVLWLWARYSRRHYVVIENSDATDAIASELGRIADALGRLAALASPRETESLPEEKVPRRENWLSLFRR